MNWHRYIPQIRDWVIVAYFALSWRLLEMIDHDKALMKDSGFMLLVGLVIGSGGLGAITNFLFGGTKVGSEVMKAQSDTLAKPPQT